MRLENYYTDENQTIVVRDCATQCEMARYDGRNSIPEEYNLLDVVLAGFDGSTVTCYVRSSSSVGEFMRDLRGSLRLADGHVVTAKTVAERLRLRPENAESWLDSAYAYGYVGRMADGHYIVM